MTSMLWDVFEPALRRTGIYTVADPTYGRYLIPPWAPEAKLDNDPNIKHSCRRLFFHPSAPFDSVDVEFAENVELVEEELSKERRRGGRWVYYKVYEMDKSATKGEGGRGVDVCVTHGLNEYGTRYSPHIPKLLEQGFRVILPDLPTYGRSTGLHSCLHSPHVLTAALFAVLQDVARVDVAKGREQSQVFLTGASMGGWTVLYYLITYPPTSDITKVISSHHGDDESEVADSEAKHQKEFRPKVAGAFAMCPMVEVAPESRPSIILEKAAPLINKFASGLAVAAAVKGKVSDDPRVEREFQLDPMTYKGKLRVCTGLSLLEGFTELSKMPEQVDLPVRIIHGNHDRATSHLATIKFYEKIQHPDKELKIYEGYEHVMMKVGIDEADDAKRQAVLEDWCSWLLKRAAIEKEKAKVANGSAA